MVGLFCHPTTTTMNKTVIQYRNKTISNYHDHTHDHVHLHGPGDWASLLIAVIVMVGFIIAVIVVACLVSYKKVIILATTCDGPLGSDSRTVPLRWRGSDNHRGGWKWGARGYDSLITSADINHGLGYKNNSGLPVTGRHTRIIIIFFTHERIVTKIVDVLQCLGQVTH